LLESEVFMLPLITHGSQSTLLGLEKKIKKGSIVKSMKHIKITSKEVLKF
jgi:hypothetical protein